MMSATLEHKGFEVVAAANVTQALRHIATESFDVLITGLHMPNAGDGFTVVTRSSQFSHRQGTCSMVALARNLDFFDPASSQA